MKLKNDIQVKAFLIRNKIPFQKHDNYLKVDETKMGEATTMLLSSYQAPEYEVMRKNAGRNYVKKSKQKVNPPLDLEKIKQFAAAQETPKEPAPREKGNYSNTQWTDL